MGGCQTINMIHMGALVGGSMGLQDTPLHPTWGTRPTPEAGLLRSRDLLRSWGLPISGNPPCTNRGLAKRSKLVVCGGGANQ